MLLPAIEWMSVDWTYTSIPALQGLVRKSNSYPDGGRKERTTTVPHFFGKKKRSYEVSLWSAFSSRRGLYFSMSRAFRIFP